MQTFGDDAGWNPHNHALSTRGGWDRAGQWCAVPFVDGEAAALVFRHRVFSFLHAEDLLSEERTRLLLSWRHSGFSVHNTVTVPPDDRDGLERLARYLLRAPVSLGRLSFDAASDRVAYARRPGRGYDHEPVADDRLTDLRELPAPVVVHISEPRRHLVRYYGAYSNVARARHDRERTAAGSSSLRLRLLPLLSRRLVKFSRFHVVVDIPHRALHVKHLGPIRALGVDDHECGA